MTKKTALLILMACVLIVCTVSFPGEFYAGDPFWMMAQSQSWLDGRDDVPAELAGHSERGQYCFFNQDRGKYYSKYGIMNSVFFVPEVAVYNIAAGKNFMEARAGDASLVLVSDIYNLLWSLLLAAVLFWGAVPLCRNQLSSLVYTLSVLFACFGFNYLRAQSGELFQWTCAAVFFSCAVHLLAGRREGKKQSLCLHMFVWAALGCLVLLKSLYVLLVPIWLAVWLIPKSVWTSEAVNGENTENTSVPGEDELSKAEHAAESASVQNAVSSDADNSDVCTIMRKQITAEALRPEIWLPPLIIAAIFLASNYWRFGSPFCTGYTQWTREADLFGGDIFEGLWGFITSADKSIFIYQPVLIIALFGIKEFWERFKAESVLAGVSFLVMLLVCSKFINWGGHWCYGPRYLLFVLSQLCWPSLLVFDKIAAGIKEWKYRIAAVCCAIMLSISFLLQCSVNSLDFFTYYRIGPMLKSGYTPKAYELYARRHFGLVNAEVIRYRLNGTEPAWLKEASREMPHFKDAVSFDNELERRAKRNYYFFP